MEIIFKQKDDSPQIPLTWNYIGEILQLQQSTILNNNDELLIYSATWNLHGKKASEEDIELFIPIDKMYHLYFIATQECLKTIGASFLNSDKEEWNSILADRLGSNYLLIDYCDLSAMNIIIFAHTSIAKSISNIRRGQIKTGFMNILANKGAIALSFDFKLKSFLFLNSHLESGQAKCDDRNEDFQRINQFLTLDFNVKNSNNKIITEPEGTKADKDAPQDEDKNLLHGSKLNQNGRKSNETNYQGNDLTITDMFDFVIWCGDFNYRINLPNDQIANAFKEKDCKELLQYDQLREEIDSGRLKLNNFDEGIIDFMPTYKYNELTDEYNFDRTPGWTDRILFKAKNICDLLQCKYSSIQETESSDHKPVFSVFKIEIKDNPKTSIIRNYNSLNSKRIATQSSSVVCLIY